MAYSVIACARSTTGRAKEANATQGTRRKVIESPTQSLADIEFNWGFHFELPDPNALIPTRHWLFDHHHESQPKYSAPRE
jgi:hypothetical protein